MDYDFCCCARLSDGDENCSCFHENYSCFHETHRVGTAVGLDSFLEIPHLACPDHRQKHRDDCVKDDPHDGGDYGAYCVSFDGGGDDLSDPAHLSKLVISNIYFGYISYIHR